MESARDVSGGVRLRRQPCYSEALTTRPPALEASGLASSIWSPPSGLSAFSSGPWGRFLVLMMPLEIPRGPCPPEGQGASNLLVRRGVGARAQLGPGWGGGPRRGEGTSSLGEKQWGMSRPLSQRLWSCNILFSNRPGRVGWGEGRGTFIPPPPQHPLPLL